GLCRWGGYDGDAGFLEPAGGVRLEQGRLPLGHVGLAIAALRSSVSGQRNLRQLPRKEGVL
ncbi:MAG: hypothetical protein AVDCRST_MAG78-1314, partial [uncultured Rubrobacteraceae bacterium]